MADSTVTALTAASTLTGAELFYCVQGGADRKATATQLAQLGGLVTGQFGVTGSGATTVAFDGSSWMTFASPNTKSFLLSTFDGASNLTRTFDQGSGRIDLFSLTAAGLASGPIVCLNFNNTSPANGDNLGHYAFRSLDPNGAANTNCYVLGNVTAVSATAMSSKLTLGVMSSLNVGAGNGQPNVSMTIDGATTTVTFPAGFSFVRSGNETVSAATGPTATYTNTTNSRNLILGVNDNFNGTINSTGGGGLNLQIAGTTGIGMTGSAIDLITATKLRIEVRASKTSNYTVLAADGGTQFDNNTAAGTVIFTLPTAPTAGYRVGFDVVTAQSLQVLAPASVTINVSGVVSAAAGNIASSQIGAYVELEYVGSNKWHAKMVTGTGGTAGAGGWTVT